MYQEIITNAFSHFADLKDEYCDLIVKRDRDFIAERAVHHEIVKFCQDVYEAVDQDIVIGDNPFKNWLDVSELFDFMYYARCSVRR